MGTGRTVCPRTTGKTRLRKKNQQNKTEKNLSLLLWTLPLLYITREHSERTKKKILGMLFSEPLKSIPAVKMDTWVPLFYLWILKTLVMFQANKEQTTESVQVQVVLFGACMQTSFGYLFNFCCTVLQFQIKSFRVLGKSQQNNFCSTASFLNRILACSLWMVELWIMKK